MAKYIHQLPQWPDFTWDNTVILPLLSNARHKQGRVQGIMNALGFDLKNETLLQTLTLDVLKSADIEGEVFASAEVRSSIARHLGLDTVNIYPTDRNIEGIVQVMLDATQNYTETLDEERLFAWHAALFPTGRSGLHKITVGGWRRNEQGPMQVVSGAMGKEKVHYEAPESDSVPQEMHQFLDWFNSGRRTDPLLASGIAHFWFVTIHPFDDGNGRIARAIADMQLARSDHDSNRFYSVSAQIRLQRNQYYDILERTQRGDLDITEWLAWFLNCVDNALNETENIISVVLAKTQFWTRHANDIVNERQRLMINKLFDGFLGKLTSSKWAKISKCSSDTALRDINDLVEKGILEKEPQGGRSTGYLLMQ